MKKKKISYTAICFLEFHPWWDFIIYCGCEGLVIVMSELVILIFEKLN